MDEFFNLRVVYNILTIHAIDNPLFFEKNILFTFLLFSFSRFLELFSFFLVRNRYYLHLKCDILYFSNLVCDTTNKKREKEMRALLSKNQNRQIDIVDYLVQANGWVHID